ncbi:MAG: CBS domain-containing protein [Pseudomonadota bacterium]|nr:CBS domain-containing protein [Pseudomonadota bacterium]
MKVTEICTRSVVTCERETTARQVAKLMREHNVGDVIVVDNGDGGRKPVGIVTDRDLAVHVVAAGVDPELIVAGDFIHGELELVLESELIYDAIWHMRSKGVRRLPVIDSRCHLVGILTADDLSRCLAAELSELTQIAPRQMQHRNPKLDATA